MYTLRRAEDRGHFDHGWLHTHHTFSFGHYQDPAHPGFRALRVINEDRVQPGRGFGTHAHDNMEILSYVLDGQLEHRDSLGNGSVLSAGQWQRMTAGTGVRHSEFNPSHELPVHFYQVWLLPDRQGLPPSYEELAPTDRVRNAFRLIASPGGNSGSLTIHQDATVHLATVDADAEVSHALAPDRHAWLQVLRGEVRFGKDELTAGDGVAMEGETGVTVRGLTDDTEVVLFDLA